ncbi:MAG: ribonuclease P protein component [Patescibacteria group bacterium]
MLSKKNRASTKEVKIIFKEGRSLGLLNLSFRYIKNNTKEVKISFIAPKNIAKLAVKRNFLRRRGYSALAKHIGISPLGITGAFVFKKYQDDISVLENEIKNILSKIN